MPRKPKVEKQTVQFVVDGVPIAVVLHPPTGKRQSWYAYWAGLVSSKSTGQRNVVEASTAAENMVRRWKAGGEGSRSNLADDLMTDAEFDEIQRVHFLVKKRDPTAKARAEKTHKLYAQASTAFRAITGLVPITRATADHCEDFQRQALGKPKNWRQQHPNSRKNAAPVSPNTILKWSRSLQAAFERACRTAGKKCIRGVVLEAKLLNANPWNSFTWIEGVAKSVRQFDSNELISFLDYLDAGWPSVTVAQALAKVFLWSRCRLETVTGLQWQAERSVGTEHHFYVVEKQGVKWWFRVPQAVFEDLATLKTSSPYVFAAYNDQLRRFHNQSGRRDRANKVAAVFNPRCLGDWFYDRLADWSASSSKGHAHPHVFRKTSLQLAWDGDDAKRQAAADAKVSEKVLRVSYLQQSDKEQREESNRNYYRIAAALPAEVACRYGYVEAGLVQLEETLATAVSAKDWITVAQVSAEIANRRAPAAG